jgi:hypothetical protein
MLGIAMGIVAGDAVEGPFAFGVAAAPGKRRALKSNPVGIGSGKAQIVMQGMALSAEAEASLARPLRRADDRRVRKPDGDGFEVIAAGTVTALAADRSIGGFRPDLG